MNLYSNINYAKLLSYYQDLRRILSGWPGLPSKFSSIPSKFSLTAKSCFISVFIETFSAAQQIQNFLAKEPIVDMLLNNFDNLCRYKIIYIVTSFFLHTSLLPLPPPNKRSSIAHLFSVLLSTMIAAATSRSFFFLLASTIRKSTNLPSLSPIAAAR